MILPDETIFFWNGIYSQWHKSPFVVGGVQYNCAEQYMMAMKALCFYDINALGAIMKTKNPAKQKEIGRGVQVFSSEKWNEISRLVVYRANLAKFTQNEELMNELMDTRDVLIVEASPYDKIWGIGISPTDPARFDTEKWQGTNWLGEAIMQVRNDIRTMKYYGKLDSLS